MESPPPLPPHQHHHHHRTPPTARSFCATDRNNKRTTSLTGSSPRPVSFYDNCVENNATSATTRTNSFNSKYDSLLNETRFNNNNSTATNTSGNSPTQAHCLLTTVPQNIAAQTIATKHSTPTRNSLRHSRMIALNQNGRVPKKYLPAIIRYHKLAKALLGLILLLGSALCFLSLWLLLWAPNIRLRDNPHWSGIPVVLSGLIGLFLMCCFRKEHPGMKRNYFVYSIKVLSVSMSTLGGILAFTACAFAIIHLVSLYSMTCEPPIKLDTTCLCRTVLPTANATNVLQPIHSYHYIDLTCLEVDNILPILILFSCATNFIAGVMEVWYVYLHWASRYVYTYSKVRTNENTPTIFTNNSR